MYVCMYVCMLFYVVHYHNNLMKAHHYHKSHQIPSDSLEKMNIIMMNMSYKTASCNDITCPVTEC